MLANSQPNPRGVRGPARAALALAGWLAVAGATLTPTAGDASPPAFGCVICGPDGGIDAIANVLLFAPLGAGLAVWGRRGRTALVLVALTTLVVEILQLRLVPGRDTSLGDLVWNFVGGALAFTAVRQWRSLVRPAPRVAALLGMAWAAVWAAGTITTAWSLAPSLAPTAWVSHVGAPATATGPVPMLTRASLDELPLGTALLYGRSGVMRQRLLDGGVLAAAGMVPAGGVVNVLVLDDAETSQIMAALLRTGGGLTYYQRTRAAALRLRSPSVTLPDAFTATAAPVAMRGWRGGPTLVADADPAGGAARRATVTLTPNWGWSLLLRPGLMTPRRAAWFSAMWVAVLVAPLGYWAARGCTGAGGSAAAGGAALAVPPAAFLLLPPAFATGAVPGSDWAAWLLGTAAGVGLAVAGRGRARTYASVRAIPGPGARPAEAPQLP
jgi:hypothetical protein